MQAVGTAAAGRWWRTVSTAADSLAGVRASLRYCHHCGRERLRLHRVRGETTAAMEKPKAVPSPPAWLVQAPGEGVMSLLEHCTGSILWDWDVVPSTVG